MLGLMNGKTFLYLSLAMLIAACLAALFPVPALAVDTSIVSVTSPDEVIECGQKFTIHIHVVPNHAIVGIQMSLAFNAGVMSIERITEGDLLSQNGAATFFNPGQVDNARGTVNGIFAAILSPGETVSTEGIIASISCIASGGTGYGSITLSNVIIGSVEGLPLPVTIINDSIFIKEKSPSGGSPVSGENTGSTGSNTGTGSGGTAVGDKRYTPISPSASADGILWEDVTVYSVDVQAQLDVCKGTAVLNANGYPPSSIMVEALSVPGTSPEGCSFVGRAYDFTPDGITFQPAANLTLRYHEDDLPEGVGESSLSIATLEQTSGAWRILSSRLDARNNCLSVTISHFSQYAVVAGIRPARFCFEKPQMSVITPLEGEKVMVSAAISNEGDQSGSTSVVFSIDGEEVSRREVALDGGQETMVNFLFSAGSAGAHTVSVGPNTLAYTVITPEPEGRIAGAITQTGKPSPFTGPETVVLAPTAGAPLTGPATATSTVATGGALPPLVESDTDRTLPCIAMVVGGLVVTICIALAVIYRGRS